MRRLLKFFAFLMIADAALAQSGNQVIIQQHNGSYNLSLNSSETVLTHASVNPSGFGLRHTIHVPDGCNIDAQPLYLPALKVKGAVQPVLYLATECDHVYAYALPNGAPSLLWTSSQGKPATSPCFQIQPDIGITETPYIDVSSGLLYDIATAADALNNEHFFLHALNVTTGADTIGPVEITAPGFSSNSYAMRSGLLEANKSLYFAFTSHCDHDTPVYHGYIFRYDAATLARQNYFNTTPNGDQGAFWNGSIAFDGTYLYLTGGNGTFDTTLNRSGMPEHGDYGNCVLKLNLSLNVQDYWTTPDTVYQSAHDGDLGSGETMLIPAFKDAQGHLHDLLWQEGKDGNIYVLDRNNLGHWVSSGFSNTYQTLQNANHGSFSSPAYFGGQIFEFGIGSTGESYSFDSEGKLQQKATTKVSWNYPGANPFITSNQYQQGIVWVIAQPSTLYALKDYNLAQLGSWGLTGKAAKFAYLIVSNGLVFVPEQNGIVDIFGLLTGE